MKYNFVVKTISILCVFLINQTYLFSQYKNVKLPKSKNPNYSYSPVEPSIIINPNNTKHIVAGTVLNEYYYSKNGGKKWRVMNMSSDYGVYGDPCLVFDNESTIYYFHLSRVLNGKHLDRIVCQKSYTMKGKFNEGTFPTPNGKVQDKEWAIVDQKNNEIFLTWTQFDMYNTPDTSFHSNIVFSMSNNGAQTWTKPRILNSVYGDCLDDDNTVEGATPSIGKNGEIYVVWTGPNGIVFNRSLDRGKTWLKNEVKIANQPGGWSYSIPGIYRCNGLPILKCDLSGGENHGTLYVNWSDQRKGTNDTDIWLSKSNDQGSTWTKPIRVNTDSTISQQFFTWMDVDQKNGDLYFVYYDRSNYDSYSLKTDVVVCKSSDGGKTFRSKIVSKSPFEPNPNIFFGDYNNISVLNGIVRPIWTRMDKNKVSVFTALINEFE